MIALRRRSAIRISHLFRWVAFVISIAVCAIGAARAHIFEQPIWSAQGQHRLLLYTGIFTVFACGMFLLRRTLLLICLAGAALAYMGLCAGWRPLGALLFFAVAMYGIGDALMRALGLLGKPQGTLLRHALAFVTGTAVWAWVAGLLAFFAWNYAVVHAALLVVPAFQGARRLLPGARRVADDAAALLLTPAGYWPAALLSYVLGAQFLMALKPEVSADGIAMHLAIPMEVAYRHFWHFDVTKLSLSVMPMAADWCFTTLYLTGGEYAAKLFPFLLLLITVLLIVHECGTSVPVHLAVLLAAGYAATPAVQLTTGSLFADNLWIVFMVAAVAAIGEASRGGNPAYLALAGLCLGSAVSTKLVAAAFVLPCAVWMFIVCRRAALAAGGAALVFFAAAAAPPNIIALVKTGNPVFPFLNAIFRAPYFDTAANFGDVRFQAPLTWRVPFDLTFHTGRFLESRDGAIGFLYLLVVLLLLAAPKSVANRDSAAWLAIGGVFFLITWRANSYVRYLMPVLPLLLFSFTRYLRFLRERQRALSLAAVWLTAGAVVTGVYLMPSSSYWHENFCLNPFAFRAEAATYVEDHAPSRILVDELNRAAPGEPVAFFTNGIAGLQARAYSTGWHNYTFFREVQQAGSGAAVNELMAKEGIRHFVTLLAKCGEPPLPQLADFLKSYTHERARAGCLYVADLDTAR